jgi:octaprenyl-diphosphate synthase
MNLGTAFQLVDDLLDFTATDEVLGKPAGLDLVEGKLTLPLIYLLESEPRMTERVQRVMLEGNYQQVTRAELLEAVERMGAMERARTRAFEFASAARDSIDRLNDSEYCDALRSIPNYIIERES